MIGGTLYRVDEITGDFVGNQSVDDHWYDEYGRYTTGNAELDELMRAATRACVASDMTQRQMLKAQFDYIVKYYRYQSKAKQKTGAAGWTESYAVPMFNSCRCNCYSFAGITYCMAKNTGYNPGAAAGLVGRNRSPHGWIEIDMNGKTYIYDTELTMAKRLAGYNYYLFEMTCSSATFIYGKR